MYIPVWKKKFTQIISEMLRQSTNSNVYIFNVVWYVCILNDFPSPKIAYVIYVVYLWLQMKFYHNKKCRYLLVKYKFLAVVKRCQWAWHFFLSLVSLVWEKLNILWVVFSYGIRFFSLVWFQSFETMHFCDFLRYLGRIY